MKSVLRRAVVHIMRSGFEFSGERGRRLMTEALARGSEPLYEEFEHVTTQRGSLTFYCLGDMTRWRARTALTKEPETVEWIDGFADGDTFWDVGANVGIYSLYAATGRNVRVVAFEPSAANYLLLNRNIELNRLADRVQAYCLAFSGKTRFGSLNMQSTNFGGALSSFGRPIDTFGNEFVPHFQQGAIGFSIDEFVDLFRPPFPNHVKIDVDGIEDEIVAGAAATLRDPRMKSLSIELDDSRPDYVAAVRERIDASGLALIGKRHGEMFAGGTYASVFNYQFRRVSP